MSTPHPRLKVCKFVHFNVHQTSPNIQRKLNEGRRPSKSAEHVLNHPNRANQTVPSRLWIGAMAGTFSPKESVPVVAPKQRRKQQAVPFFFNSSQVIVLLLIQISLVNNHQCRDHLVPVQFLPQSQSFTSLSACLRYIPFKKFLIRYILRTCQQKLSDHFL